MIELYTDGSGTNGGPTGWAWVAVENNQEIARGTSGNPQGTCNTAEMMAVIDGLKWARENAQDQLVTVCTDSAYIANCFNDKWYEGWFKRNWKNSRGKRVANKEHWLIMLDLVSDITPEFKHVPGHTGIKFNELADQLAKQARKEQI